MKEQITNTMMTGTKQPAPVFMDCHGCGERKPLDQFPVDPSVEGLCNTCNDIITKQPAPVAGQDTTGYENTWHLIFQTCIDLGMSMESDVAISGEQLVCKFIRELVEKVNSKPSDYRMPFTSEQQPTAQDVTGVLEDTKFTAEFCYKNGINPFVIEAFCAAVWERIAQGKRCPLKKTTL